MKIKFNIDGLKHRIPQTMPKSKIIRNIAAGSLLTAIAVGAAHSCTAAKADQFIKSNAVKIINKAK